jgi:hypothetical protein
MTGTAVDFYIAHPHRTVYLHLCIEKIRTGITVVQTRVYHLYLFAIGSVHIAHAHKPVFPAVVQQLFHNH